MSGLPTARQRHTPQDWCPTCWYQETPRVKTVGCPCCEADHLGGHPDTNGTPCRSCGMGEWRCNLVPVGDFDGPLSDCCKQCDHA